MITTKMSEMKQNGQDEELIIIGNEGICFQWNPIKKFRKVQLDNTVSNDVPCKLWFEVVTPEETREKKWD